MAPYLRSSARIISLFSAKYWAPLALSSSDARISSGQLGILAASFCACTMSMPSESHFVNGHSHMPERSGFDISLAMNFSGERPGRSSHSGTNPASGAVRSGGSIVLPSAEEKTFVVCVENPRTAGAEDAKARAASESLMM